MQTKGKIGLRLKLFKLLFFMFILSGTAFANQKMSVITYTDKEGLPRNIVKSFTIDKFGYGWVGTGNGIARFDGYNFEYYEALRGRIINKIIIDNKNRVWAGSDKGLYLYNRLTDSFSFIQEGYIKDLKTFDGKIYILLVNRLLELGPNKIQTEYQVENINAFAVTKEGIWINNGNEGVKLIGTSTLFLKGRIISLIQEIDNNLWVACRNGALFKIDKKKDVRKIDIENRYNIMDIEKINDELWLSTDGNGILILDKNFNFLRQIKKEYGQETILSSNSVYDVAQGMNGAVWISTYGAGLICLQPENSAFVNFTPNPKNSNSLIDKEGISVFINQDLYYFGTNYGFSSWDKNKNKFINVNSNKLKKQIQGSKVTAITSANNAIFIATYDGLTGKFSKNLKLLKTYSPCTGDATEMQRVILFYKYSSGVLLVGTQFRNKSLLKFDVHSAEFTPVTQNLNGQIKTSFQINSIRKNQFGEVVALIRNNGIFIYRPEKNSLESFVPNINNRITFKLNDFYHDKNGDYWFTTQANGLVRMSPDGKLFDKWTTKQGFPTNSLLRIESVDDKILWISSIDGLCRFDMNTEQIQIFNYRQGLASNEFLPRTSAVTPDHKIIFGNSEGFTLIDPEKLIADTTKAKVIISDINFHNKSIKALKNENYLKVPLEKTKKIKLPFKRNSFTITFFTHDNFLPKYNNFEYRLLGLENNWIYLGAHNETTYTNLSPGKYTFQVKSTNKSNIWNEEPTTLEIEILPPWYLTWIAFVAYIVFIAFLVWLIFRTYANRLQLKKEIEISQVKVKSEHELTERKLAFFTNISHDLKTPLTLISAPINDLLQSENLKKEQKKKLDVAKRNANRLYKLISDLVDFRKITQNQLPLKTQLTNLKPVIENIFESFKIECNKRNLFFSFQINFTERVFIDVKKIEKILWNLLANAIKFTNDNGKIWVNADLILQGNDQFLKIEVGDTGKGFSDDEKEKIFNRFYQIRKSENINFESSGIGLSIVNDLVKIHHGEIHVDSTPGKGTIFTLILPAEEKFYREEEKWEAANLGQEIIYPQALQEPTTTSDILEQPEIKRKKYSLPEILIVEDDKELREYLISHFSKEYKVHYASNGTNALKLLDVKEPNLIITDVEMPGMNGYEFCAKVKQNYTTSHIPIIMLTANSTVEKKLEGLAAGADNYVTKPFEIQYLDAIAKSLLANRKKIQERFLRIDPPKSEFENLTPSEIAFVNSLKEFILKNITNEKLNIDMLSKHFSISRTQLNRKIKTLTGFTPNNYIRTTRLKKAYELIKIRRIRVSEAAYLTGFPDPNYFTSCFKKEFGENPSKINQGDK